MPNPAILRQLLVIDTLLLVTGVLLAQFKARWCRFVAVVLVALAVAVGAIEMVVLFTL